MGGKPRVFPGGADGGVGHRLGQRHRSPQKTAAGAELAATFEADEAAVDRRLGDLAQDGRRGRRGPRAHGGLHAPARRPEHPLLLLLAQDRAAAGAGRHGLRGHDVADADGHAAAAPITRPVVEPPGNRRLAPRAAAFADAIAAQDVAVALDHGLAAAGTIRRLPAAVADVAGVDVVQAAAAGDVVGRGEGLRRRGPAIGELEVGMKRGKVQGHVRAQLLHDPAAHALDFQERIVRPRDDQVGNFQPDVAMAGQPAQRVQHRLQLAVG